MSHQPERTRGAAGAADRSTTPSARVIDNVLVSLQGTGRAGLEGLLNGLPPDPRILRPPALRGRVLQIDATSALAATAAVCLRACIGSGVEGERIGIVLGSRHGNHLLARRFADRVRSAGNSPAAFSTSGYNISASLAAMAAEINGPSLVVAGALSRWADIVTIALGYLRRGDADMMLAGQVDTAVDGSSGLCAMVALGLGLYGEPAKASLQHATASRAPQPLPSTPSLPPELAVLDDALRVHLFLTPTDARDRPPEAHEPVLSGTLGQRVAIRASAPR